MKKKRLKKLLIIDMILLISVVTVFVSTQYAGALDMNGNAEITVELGEKFEDPGVKSSLASSSGDVDTSKVGEYTITYRLWGKSTTRTVHVIDPKQFVVGLKGSEIQKVREGDPYVEGGAFAIDKKTGPAMDTDIETSGKVDTSKPGTYTVTYKVKFGGIERTATRQVEVISKDKFGKKADLIPVLMYHWIYSDKDEPEIIDGNWIYDKELEKHLEYLNSEKYYYPSWKELKAWIDGEIELPEKSVILTFDDGKTAFLKNGKPLFEKYKIPVTSFMICWNENNASTKIKKYASEYIDFESQTYALHRGGSTPGYRGVIADLDKQEIGEDLRKAYKVLGNNDAMSYPYGDYTDEAREAIKEEGILCAFTTEYGRVKRGMDNTILPRIRVFNTTNFETWKDAVSNIYARN